MKLQSSLIHLNSSKPIASFIRVVISLIIAAPFLYMSFRVAITNTDIFSFLVSLWVFSLSLGVVFHIIESEMKDFKNNYINNSNPNNLWLPIFVFIVAAILTGDTISPLFREFMSSLTARIFLMLVEFFFGKDLANFMINM
ncbi:hypothetical protein ABRP83_13470 [Pectobacterium brasiliense]|uniref:hypothetical protein n=1 Tax=Pectobacterium brasiliense TaxID=180957 RepID=UPI0032ED5A76